MDTTKIALVTGGSRGIGLAIAKKLGKDGYQVAIVATRDSVNYPEAIKTLEDAGVTYRWYVGDIAQSDDRKRIIASVKRDFGAIHVLVNNAGIAPKTRCDLLDMSEESWDRVMNTNAKGNMFMTQLVVKQMLTQGKIDERRGTIVNVSSCSAAIVSINRGEYCVSKAGVSMLTKLYAARLGDEGINVYEVRPGVIATDMTKTVQKKYDKLFASGSFPIARWGLPEDVANIVSAFCSGAFAYSTGNYIDVDGGFHIQQL